MNEFPICTPDLPTQPCCLVAIPNTSEWQVVCPRDGALTTVPVMTEWGALLFGLLLVLVAVRRLR